VVSYTLEMARAQEENGADTPEAPRQENGREGRIEIPGEDGEWLRAEAREMAYIAFKRDKHGESLRLLCQTLAIQRRIGVPTKSTAKGIAVLKRRVPGGGC
jgi:hypothetical protein